MTLGTGALKVSGEGPEEYKHGREASMATRQAGTTRAARLAGTVTLKLVQWNTNQLDTYRLIQVTLREGRVGLTNPQESQAKGTDPQRSQKCKAVRDLLL